MIKKIYIIGIGLIGGSFALELRKLFPKSKIIGIDNSENNLGKALELGIIDEKTIISQIKNPDIIIVSVPVKSIINLLPTILDCANNNTLIMDIEGGELELFKTFEIKQFNKIIFENHYTNNENLEIEDILKNNDFNLIERIGKVEYWKKD